MSTIGATTIGIESTRDELPQDIAWTKPASPEAVERVLAADPDDDDGRSEWLWVRFANGDLILGVFPQGETYSEHEEEASF